MKIGTEKLLVLLHKTNHRSITGKIKNSAIESQFYEDRYREAIERLLQGKAPEHWDAQDRRDFEAEHPNGENYRGISFLFYY